MRMSPTLRRTIATASLACALLAGASAHAAGVDPITATNVQKLQAQRLFLKGREYATQKKCDLAITEFRASFFIVASPNTRLALARCLDEIGKPVEAYGELLATIADARALAPREARYGETADAAELERKEVAAKIVLLTLKIDHASEGTAVKIGDRDVPREALAAPIPLMPGTIEIVVTNAGKEVARSTLTVGPGDTTVTLDAEPPPPAKTPDPTPLKPIDPNDVPRDDAKPKPPAPPPASNSGLRTAAYVAGGVGAAGLITFGVFGLLEKGTYSDLQSACHNGPCGPDKSGDVSTGKTQQTIANIGLVVGAVGVATGVVLFIVSSPKKTDGGTSAAIVVTPSFIGLRGSL
jgi:hypothetical protein